MNISRKEFFRESLISLSKAVYAVAGVLKPVGGDEPEAQDEQEFVSVERPELLAMADNGRCLARSCGCFACIERCEPQAINLVFGSGIKIDAALCTGCGWCEHLCPVNPKAISLVLRDNNKETAAQTTATKV